MDVFLYGTLLDDILRDRLLGRATSAQAATLMDYTVLRHNDAPLPALIPRPGKTANGVIVRDLSVADLARLNAYELPFGYSVTSVEIQIGAQNVAVCTYVPDDTVSVSDTPWSLAEWQDTTAPLSREMMREIGAYDPPLTGAALKQQWHMIALRAGVRLRAAADKTPTAVRYAPKSGDFGFIPAAPLVGNFFKFTGFQVTHRSFQDTTLGPLDREVMLACDAAIVLPYDPKTDRVLLVEQIRMGPMMRTVPNPWMLEPVAGMIDGHETPEDAARRETMEEAGLTDVTLEKMFSFYPSPGSSTDYFYCFAGLGPLPEPTTYTGGLAAENEDLRIHVMALSDALDLIETGEANVGPLIAMLLWVARHKDRLRGAA